MIHTVISPDMPIADAARLMMGEELATVMEHMPALRKSANVTAVHETRKAIRRSFTLFKLVTPYFAPGELVVYRRGLRRIMRRLAPCRDLAVFRQKLEAYNETAEQPLSALAAYWKERQQKANRRLQRYVGRKTTRRFLKRYAAFTQAGDTGHGARDGQFAPLLVRHVLPALTFQRFGAARACGDILDTATPAQFHQLRIQFKELRYTLTYFEDILGGPCSDIIDLTRQMQDHLGSLNDASVATSLLADMDCCVEEALVYGAVQQAELTRLSQEFGPLYKQIDRLEIRRELALALADL